jgi:glycosyltransferase involved in cell wall biosynthesis
MNEAGKGQDSTSLQRLTASFETLFNRPMPLKITFALPDLSLSGGHKITLMYANGLADRGHDVTVVHGQLPTLKGRIRSSLFPRSIKAHRPGPKVRLVAAKGKAADLPDCLPDADVVIASWWETVEAINQSSAAKGRKIHHVQGHEVFPYLPSRSASVYRLPLKKIAVSRWLFDLMRHEYGASDVSLVLNPVDTDHFGWINRARSSNPTVGTIYASTLIKNSKMAFEALGLARKVIPDLKFICFGAEKLPPNLAEIPLVQFHRTPQQDIIPDLYRSCDCWLFTSQSEGFGLPILEAMAVGTPVIGTAAGAAPDLITERTGALVSQDPADMASAIVSLLSKPSADWEMMSRACRATAEAHDVETAVSEFEAIVCAQVQG